MRSEFSSNPAVIENYNLLAEIGVFKEIDNHTKRIGDLEDLLRQASGIFSKTSLEALLDFVVDCISNRFIPGDLVFILQDRSGKPQYFGFKNLRHHDYNLHLQSIAVFEEFFVQYPQTISFELFDYQFEHPEYTGELKRFNPEIMVPIVGLNGLYGIILVSNKIPDAPYDEQEIHYLDRLMNFTSVSIQNNIHYLSAVTDLKTHLYNHVFFEKRLVEEIELSEEFDSNLGLIVLDVDNFKIFNDTHGHLAGDMVLKAIASILTHSLRRGDIASRFGGEEFTVLLPASTRQQTWFIAERLRSAIAKLTLEYNNRDLQVTASFGCSVFHTLNVVDSEQLLIQADSALYESKRRGRNQTTMYKPGLLVAATQLRITDSH